MANGAGNPINATKLAVNNDTLASPALLMALFHRIIHALITKPIAVALTPVHVCIFIRVSDIIYWYINIY